MTCITSKNVELYQVCGKKYMCSKPNFKYRNQRSGIIDDNNENKSTISTKSEESVINNNAKWGLPKGHLKILEKNMNNVPKEKLKKKQVLQLL